jgi:hypothetical protein
LTILRQWQDQPGLLPLLPPLLPLLLLLSLWGSFQRVQPAGPPRLACLGKALALAQLTAQANKQALTARWL